MLTIKLNEDIKPTYIVMSKDSDVMCLYTGCINEIKESLGGDLDKDWIIYSITTYKDEIKKNDNSISKRVIPNRDRMRLKKLGL